MESRTHCAYNLTRECFLGFEVAPADLSYLGIVELMSRLTLKSGQGVWMRPFRGLPTAWAPAPMDLIYLDEGCRVIDTIESFPNFRVTSCNSEAASVLALPVHSIYSSQTQAGDQLVLCVAEEMEQRLEWIAGRSHESRGSDGNGTKLRGAEAKVQSAVMLREEPLWGGGPGVVELDTRRDVEEAKPHELHEMRLVEPGKKPIRPPRKWRDRWWAPDPREAPRRPAPGLAAYYWDGNAPNEHSIRDISASGLYLITEERWYPGTLILLTLQKKARGKEMAEYSIAVQSRAVRWGNDGVGLQFVVPDADDLDCIFDREISGADRKALNRFLAKLRTDK